MQVEQDEARLTLGRSEQFKSAFQYLPKPCDIGQLRAMVGAAVDTPRRRAGEAAGSPAPAPRTSSKLVGEGEAMRALREAIDLVAASSAPRSTSSKRLARGHPTICSAP